MKRSSSIDGKEWEVGKLGSLSMSEVRKMLWNEHRTLQRWWGAGSGLGRLRRVMYLRRVSNGCMWHLTERMVRSWPLDKQSSVESSVIRCTNNMYMHTHSTQGTNTHTDTDTHTHAHAHTHHAHHTHTHHTHHAHTTHTHHTQHTTHHTHHTHHAHNTH